MKPLRRAAAARAPRAAMPPPKREMNSRRSFDHPSAIALRTYFGSTLRRQNDAEYDALVLTHLSRSADVSATIGRDHVVDLVVGNRRPCTVQLNFVVVANHATLGRPTIHQIAA